MNTGIEELRDAAQSIQSLQRVLKVVPESGSKNGPALLSFLCILIMAFYRVFYY